MSDSVEVSGLFIYPVKSLRGVAGESAALTNGRLAGDRQFVVVDPNGRFMDLRHHPRMARIEATITSTGLRLRCAGLPDLEFRPPRANERTVLHVFMFRRSAPVTPTSIEADQWLSEALSLPCRLMAFVPDAAALNVPFYEVHASLQDATPFHLTSEESLADLNARTPYRCR